MNLFWILPCAFLYIGYSNCTQFKIMTHCPLKKLTWNQRAEVRNCTEGTHYHCMQIRNGRLAEVCMGTLALNPKDGCPVLGIGPFSFVVIGYFTCSESRGCPVVGDGLYPSDELYKYPACLLWNTDIKLENHSSVSQNDVQTTVVERNTTTYINSDQPSSQNLARTSPNLIATSRSSEKGKEDQFAPYVVYGIAFGGIILFLILLMVGLVVASCILSKTSASSNVQNRGNIEDAEIEHEEENHYDYVDEADINDTERVDTREEEECTSATAMSLAVSIDQETNFE